MICLHCLCVLDPCTDGCGLCILASPSGLTAPHHRVGLPGLRLANNTYRLGDRGQCLEEHPPACARSAATDIYRGYYCVPKTICVLSPVPVPVPVRRVGLGEDASLCLCL